MVKEWVERREMKKMEERGKRRDKVREIRAKIMKERRRDRTRNELRKKNDGE